MGFMGERNPQIKPTYLDGSLREKLEIIEENLVIEALAFFESWMLKALRDYGRD